MARSKKARYVDFYPDELISAVAGEMTPEELGVYWMICTLIYSRRKAIPDDREWLQGKFKRGLHLRSLNAILDRLIASGRVSQSDGKLMVERCREELEKTLNRISKAQENGSQGGRPPKESKDLPKPDGSSTENLTLNHQPSTNNQQPVSGAPQAAFTLEAEDQQQGKVGEKAKRGTRLAADAELPERLRLWAKAEGHPDPDAEWESFRDYWVGVSGREGVKTDWDATFRNRVRRVLADGRPAVTRKAVPSDAPPELTAAFAPYLARLRQHLGDPALRSWFTKCDLREERGGLVLIVPSPWQQQYMRQNYDGQISAAFAPKKWRIEIKENGGQTDGRE